MTTEEEKDPVLKRLKQGCCTEVLGRTERGQPCPRVFPASAPIRADKAVRTPTATLRTRPPTSRSPSPKRPARTPAWEERRLSRAGYTRRPGPQNNEPTESRPSGRRKDRVGRSLARRRSGAESW